MPFNVQNILKQIAVKTGTTKSPSETFYLSLSQTPHTREVTVFNLVQIGTTNSTQSSTSPLYKEESLRTLFGKSMSVATIFNTHPQSNSVRIYNSSVETVFKTPKGDIGISHSPMLRKFSNFYELPLNHIEIAQITFGTGIYLNKRGYVGIATGAGAGAGLGAPNRKLIMVFIQ
jgi:hypothetical protein